MELHINSSCNIYVTSVTYFILLSSRKIGIGCVVQMKNYEEALAEIEEVLKDFIQDYINDGDELPTEDLTIKNLKVAV